MCLVRCGVLWALGSAHLEEVGKSPRWDSGVPELQCRLCPALLGDLTHVPASLWATVPSFLQNKRANLGGGLSEGPSLLCPG